MPLAIDSKLLVVKIKYHLFLFLFSPGAIASHRALGWNTDPVRLR